MEKKNRGSVELNSLGCIKRGNRRASHAILCLHAFYYHQVHGVLTVLTVLSPAQSLNCILSCKVRLPSSILLLSRGPGTPRGSARMPPHMVTGLFGGMLCCDVIAEAGWPRLCIPMRAPWCLKDRNPHTDLFSITLLLIIGKDPAGDQAR